LKKLEAANSRVMTARAMLEAIDRQLADAISEVGAVQV
jgi:hypothetical protein